MDQVLEELEGQLDSLYGKKTELLAEIADIDTKIKRVKAEHGRVTNCSAEIYRLPNEILCYIFEIGKALSNSPGKYPPVTFSRDSKFEVLVSHVSSHWRAVALGCPALWSNIRGWMAPSRILEEFETYLERSKGYPLDVTFSFDSALPQSEREMALISLISAHVGRWRNVCLDMEFLPTYLMVLASIHKHSAPLLQYFSICPFSDPPANSDDPHGPIFTGGAPNLKHLRLSGSALSILQPPLGAVTTLHLEYPNKDWSMTYTRFNDIISSSHLLENLSMYGIVITEWPTGLRTLSIPSLRSLRMQGTADFVYALTSAIAAPYLDSLVVAECTDDDTTHPWDPIPFLESPEVPKFPRLRTLTFKDCYLTSWTSQNVFHALPTITHFALLGSFGVETLKALGDDCTQPSELPWPGLHTLTIERLETAQESLLCSTVLAGRKQLGRPIGTLRLESQLRAKLRRKGKLEWLEKVVKVVKWSTMEAWPPGSDFIAEGDYLFTE
jgi:hypothetical protein